ncbi:MAG: hypothetical protein O2884_03615 [Chloroflexi bacterium]|nr:hypothetical protein [Chloroflexota bacterium]
MTSMSLMEPTLNPDSNPEREEVLLPTFVLLAERDDTLREVTARALEATGNYCVVEVPDIQEALEQMEKIAFAALLLDPRVEGMEDMRAIEALYLMADRAGCPVIAFSDIPQSDLGLAYPFGFAGVVPKPFWALNLGDQVSDIRAGFTAGRLSGGDT